QPHPQGGFFRETYRADGVLRRESLPGAFGGDGAFSTAIYFLLRGEDFSAFHRLEQGEVWHHYDGASITLHILDPEGRYTVRRVGKNVRAGEVPQAVVKGGCWFAAHVNDIQSCALLGCTVAPGFDFADFEMPRRAELCA